MFHVFVLDVISTSGGFNYFQGFAQVLAALFFVFLRDELLVTGGDVLDGRPENSVL